MKVLVLSELSNSSRYWEGALPLLKNRGIKASFATIKSAGPIHKELVAQNITVTSFDAKSSRDYPYVISRLRKYIRENKFDIVHASEAIPATLAGVACRFSRTTKCIFHYHHTRVTGRQKWLSLIGSRLADCVMTVSKSSQMATIKFDRTPREKTFLAYNGINPLRDVTCDEIEALRKRFQVPDDALVVTIVSRLRTVKGHRTLFEACQKVSWKTPKPLHLFVVGDGEEMSSLVELSDLYDRFTTHFVGHQDDVALWFSAADVIAMPSYFEPFGLVAVEAMACGKALVASDVEGLSEIIENGVTGFLVAPKDPVALAAGIRFVFDSFDLAEEMGANAKRHVLQRYSMESMIDAWIECYELVDKPK